VLEGNARDASPIRFAYTCDNVDRVLLSALTSLTGFAMTVLEKYCAGNPQTIGQTLCAALLTAASFARTIAASAPWRQLAVARPHQRNRSVRVASGRIAMGARAQEAYPASSLSWEG
jgi:hypothetical protein